MRSSVTFFPQLCLFLLTLSVMQNYVVYRRHGDKFIPQRTLDRFNRECRLRGAQVPAITRRSIAAGRLRDDRDNGVANASIQIIQNGVPISNDELLNNNDHVPMQVDVEPPPVQINPEATQRDHRRETHDAVQGGLMEIDPLVEGGDADLPNFRREVDEFEEIDPAVGGGDVDIQNFIRALYLDDRAEFLPRKPHSIYDYINSGKLSDPITVPVDKTRGEILLMMLKYSLANNLTANAMVNLFGIGNNIFSEPILPNSKYTINKLIDTGEVYELHAICHNCQGYLGKFGEIPATLKTCPFCKTHVDVSSPSSTSFFVIIDPSRQIAALLKTYGRFYYYVMNERRSEKGVWKDTFDGLAYQNFVASLPPELRKRFLTCVLNTDGAEKFSNSQLPIWPLFLMVNELPVQARMKNLVVCGFWCHKKKPEMNVFLDPFVDIMNRLSEDGIDCEINGVVQNIKPFVTECSVDLGARAPMQRIHQHNGNCGCSLCLHPGKSEGGSMRYPYKDYHPALRNEESFIEAAKEATHENPIDGIVGFSPLIRLKKFKIVKGIIIDYLHNSLEGNAKTVAGYHLDSMSVDEIKELDDIMESIHVPCQLSRLTRKISERHLWKAKEWENFVLYYSIPIFARKLSKKHFDHWLLFVESLYIILQDRIIKDDLIRANTMLHEFVEKTEKYFGILAMRPNMHGLLHVIQNIIDWGPAWTNSTFPFETQNRYALNAIKSANGVMQQVIRWVSLKQTISLLEEHVYPNASELVKYFCNDVLSYRSKSTLKITDISYFGLGKDFVDSDSTRQLNLSELTTKVYTKMVKDGCLYSGRSKIRSDDSYAQLKNGTLVKIMYFLADKVHKIELTVCKKLLSRSCFGRRYSKMHIVDSEMNECSVVPSNEIDRICVSMKVYGKHYVCPVPNLIHY